MVTVALQALGAVHACKLLHVDVGAWNIMVVQGTHPSVCRVCFGFICRNSNRSLCEAELCKLQCLLQGIAVGVAAPLARHDGSWSGERIWFKLLCLGWCNHLSRDSDEEDSTLSISRNANLLGV